MTGMAPSISTGWQANTVSRPPAGLDSPVSLTLRPRSTLFRDGAVAVLALTLPILGALFFIDLAAEVWLVVLVIGAVLVTLLIGSVRGLGRTGIWATETEFVERGFFGRTSHVRFSDVASIVTIQCPPDFERESTDQLFALSGDGRALLRLRGQFWSRSSMQEFIGQCSAPVTLIEDPDSGAAYMRSHPEQLYWFERRPLFARLLVAALAVASVILGIYLIVTLTAPGG